MNQADLIHREEVGIDPDPEYVLYEFWTEKSFGMMKGTFETEIPAHSVRILAMHKAKETSSVDQQ